MDTLSAASTSFALSLFRKLSENASTKNVFFSPFSISSALSMVFLGTKGNTAAQMKQVLCLSKAEDIHKSYQSLVSEINKPDTKYILRTANQLYAEKTYEFLANESKPVQMMFRKAKFNMTYIQDFQTKILELPYIDNELSMIILLPDNIEDETTGLEKLERELSYEKLTDWINPEMMDYTEVEVSLPRFKLEENYDLKTLLSSMGMPDAFDQNKADLSGMAGNKNLYLSEVVHKSFVEVNEEGTEAAAATAAVVVIRCAMIVPRFTADHPFFFLIRHNKTANILFFGRFCSP
ncbi:PREDICTED: serpin B6-like isoform X2 [Crocodylus porosus]|uniref:serpin B6-like isoform X2 n=1 Tax=Crocodylus porosus TaxID=8502 RepID=UPI00093A32E3|nr:PREDICTED: serpin B6-like isoform X2 [Crocodylus porosus]